MWLKAQCWHAVVKRVKNDYSDPFQHRFAARNGLALTWENQCCCFNEQKKKLKLELKPTLPLLLLPPPPRAVQPAVTLIKGSPARRQRLAV